MAIQPGKSKMMRAMGIVLVAALLASIGHAQSQPPAVKSTTAGVLIDVSVLDNKGQPANATMDGTFRRVGVKVKRRNVTARARPGYLAVPQELR